MARCMAAEDLAKQGAPDALRTLFLAAYVPVSQPFLGGEGGTMTTIFREVVTALGDDRFALALAAQRPEVAAPSIISEETDATSKKCPRT